MEGLISISESQHFKKAVSRRDWTISTSFMSVSRRIHKRFVQKSDKVPLVGNDSIYHFISFILVPVKKLYEMKKTQSNSSYWKNYTKRRYKE